MDDGRWTIGAQRAMDDRGFLTADGGPQTAKVMLADGPPPLDVILPPCFHPSPVVIPETGGLDLYMIKNALPARYPGSREDWLYWTTDCSGRQTTDGFGRRTTDYGRQRGEDKITINC